MKEAGVDVDTLQLISLVGQQVQLQGTEGSLSKKSYKQLTGPGKQHSTVFTIARSIVTHSAKQSSMVLALNRPISEFRVQPATELQIVPGYIVAAEQSEFY